MIRYTTIGKLEQESQHILASMGVLVWSMQSTERIFNFVLLLVFAGKRKLTLQKFETLKKKKRSQTLGQLVRQMRERVELRPSLAELLDNFVEHRNQLIHRLYEVPGWDLDTIDGQKVATKFLSQLHAENLKVLQIFLAFLIAWENQHKLGVVEDLPSEIVERLPEISVFVAMINDLVSAKEDTA